jgi:MFS family permease
MFTVLRSAWALLLGMLLLMLGNGLQGTLLGIRGAIEGYDAGTMSLVMSAYFVGFLLGSYRAPAMIRRVGHVRVFAALASVISGVFILYAAAPDPWVWIAMRLAVGFCFAGVYVVAESWLNDAATNETRGQALSLYMIVQMVGIITAQGVVNLADPAGYDLFVVMSVLVSVSVTPILLAASDAPAFQTPKRMTLVQLFQISPLGCVGTFLLGGVLAGTFGMGAVFGMEKGLSVGQISAFVAAIYTGGLLAQFPIGWISDRMDRRRLILRLTAAGSVAVFAGFALTAYFPVVLLLGFVIGAVANPLYSLLIAHTNDFLDHSDMAAAAGGLLFINGFGAMTGPLAIGALMTTFGPGAFFIYIGTLLALISAYAAYRATQRPSPPVASTSSYAPVAPQASPVALEVAQEVAIERAEVAAAEHAGGQDTGRETT